MSCTDCIDYTNTPQADVYAGTGNLGGNELSSDSGHQHPTSGLPVYLEEADIQNTTRYAGATDSGLCPAETGGDLQTGDFVIDQLAGVSWVLTQSGNWLGPWMPGDIKQTAALVAPAGWLVCDGSAQLDSDYPNLFSALVIELSGVTVHNGSATVDVSSTNGIVPGMPVFSASTWPDTTEVIASGTTVDAVSPGVSIELSLTPSDPGGPPTVTATLFIAPWGYNPSESKFNLPDMRSNTAVGASTNGAAGSGLTARVLGPSSVGAEGVALTAADQGPAHNHSYTEPNSGSGHSHGYSEPNSGSGHSHGVSDSGHGHNSADNYPFLSNYGTIIYNGQSGESAMHNDTIAHSTTGIGIDDSVTGITISDETTGISISDSGGSATHNNMPPFAAVYYIVKT